MYINTPLYQHKTNMDFSLHGVQKSLNRRYSIYEYQMSNEWIVYLVLSHLPDTMALIVKKQKWVGTTVVALNDIIA
jgi:hypothetical protein